jgi:hypothetical protein
MAATEQTNEPEWDKQERGMADHCSCYLIIEISMPRRDFILANDSIACRVANDVIRMQGQYRRCVNQWAFNPLMAIIHLVFAE